MDNKANSPLKTLHDRISEQRRPVVIISLVVLMALIAWAAYLRFVKGIGWADWTGLGPYTDPKGEYYRAKTFWDWLELLIVPIILAIGAYWFNNQEKKRERDIAKDRQLQQVLVDYLQTMSDLLLDRSLLEKKGNEQEPVRNVAQTITATTLRVLDKDRRNIVIQFLRDAGLANELFVKASLASADLSGTDLGAINLSKAELIYADLRGAYMQDINLSYAHLHWAKLNRANLMKANMNGILLHGANLSDANLMDADLSSSYLMDADLSGANLDWAKLDGAQMDRANLKGANVSGEQLATVKSLRDATMPDGTIHK